MQLRDALLLERAWRGTMDELAAKASLLCRDHPVAEGVYLPETTRTLIVSYRSRHILPPAAGKQFRWEHLVRLLAGRHLVTQGWGREEVALYLRSHPTEFLAANLGISPTPVVSDNSPSGVTAHQLEQATLAVRLLAAGIAEQYSRARRGDVLVHNGALSEHLVQAMFMFAGLFLQAGLDNVLGSVHDLLGCCQRPMIKATFGLDVLSHPDFQYNGMVLIDPDRRIPTLDCAELARQTSSALDLREQLAFDALREASGQFVGREAEAYSALRLWIVEHPVTTVNAQRLFLRDRNLQLAAGFMAGCYEPFGAKHLIDGELHLCPACGTPMHRSLGAPDLYACTIRQCRKFDMPVQNVASDVSADTVIVNAAVMLYWVGPGLDEAALYRQAIKCQRQPRVYPNQDACDVSLDDDTTGVDIKSYSNPHVLADKLSRSPGGLVSYPKRIVAINDRTLDRWHGYLDVLKRRYTGPIPLQFMSVRELIKSLEIPF
jgi:hypothetical protein